MKYIYVVCKQIADTVFPQPKLTRWLENCTPDELRKRCTAAFLPQPSQSISSLFSYRDRTVRHMIWEIKYRGSPFIRQTVATLLSDVIKQDLEDQVLFDNVSSHVIVTAVPMPPKRKQERGWNQSELLAKEVARELGNWAQYQATLTRAKECAQQTTLDQKQRKKNMKGAFKVIPGADIKNKTVVIIDDVTTTGATLMEAMKVLEKAGARKVLGYTVAH